MESARPCDHGHRAERRAQFFRLARRHRLARDFRPPAPPRSRLRSSSPLPSQPRRPNAAGRASVRRCRWAAWSPRAPLRRRRLRVALRRARRRSPRPSLRLRPASPRTRLARDAQALAFVEEVRIAQRIHLQQLRLGTLTRAAISSQRVAATHDVEVADRRTRGRRVRGRRRSFSAAATAAAAASRARQRARQLFGKLQVAAGTQTGVRGKPFISREARGRHAVALRDGRHALALAHPCVRGVTWPAYSSLAGSRAASSSAVHFSAVSTGRRRR